MADTQNPVYTDSTINGDGTSEHPLSVANPLTPALAANIPQSVSVTLTAAQLKALGTASAQLLPPAPGKLYVPIFALAEYKLGAGPTAFGNATGNSINFQYAAASGGPLVPQMFFGIETDDAGTFEPAAVAAIDLTSAADGSVGFGPPANNLNTGAAMYNANTIGKGIFAVATNGSFTLGDGTIKITLWYYEVTP